MHHVCLCLSAIKLILFLYTANPILSDAPLVSLFPVDKVFQEADASLRCTFIKSTDASFSYSKSFMKYLDYLTCIMNFILITEFFYVYSTVKCKTWTNDLVLFSLPILK